MSNAGKNRRAEEQFTPAQRAKMLWLVENSYGIEAVMERFGLSEEAADAYIKGEIAARKAKEQAGIDWAARFAEFRTVG